ncbi:MAG: TonB-dependent receptor, partial [Prolixibacteraceae bacterium]|nr:TonB-dependent receptor [Prolixibacteraceae bacterium]
KSSSGKDADGTSLPALFLKSNSDADLFFQEIRYNFSRRSRTNDSIGINYIRGKGDFKQELSSNDQTLLNLLTTPGSFVMPSESRFPVNPQALNPSPMAGVNLPGDHGEHMITNINEQSFQAFLQFTYQLTSRIFFTAGARGGYDLTKVSGESVIAGDSPSALGMYTNSDPNLLYSPGPLQSVKNSSLSVSGQAGLTYRWNENFNFFINAVKGRRPELIQFTWDNKSLILDPETVNSLEAGYKISVLHRIFFDATGYFRQHKNVHAISWSDTEGRGLNSSDGKAKSYGVDAGLHVALLKGINLFGSYAWLNPVFDSTDVPGRDYIYGGNIFAFSPGHSFASGVSANFKILPLVGIFANSWYSRRSHFWFSESNTPGLEQLSYGILNANAGVKFDKPSVTVSVYGTNLLEENYVVSAGHPGGLFGLPTFVPGPPMMLGIKMMWEF